MSTLFVPLSPILKIEPHPNPEVERLEIATVKGWQCIVQRGRYKEGQSVIYIPPDSVLTDEFIQKMDINYVGKRVKAIQLKGFVSMGLILDPVDVQARIGVSTQAMFDSIEDVSGLLGITKYEPPLPTSMDVCRENVRFPRYTNIENIRHFPDELVVGEEVNITEKIHGTNIRIGRIDGDIVVGTRNTQLKQGENKYWKAALKLDLDKIPEDMILYGELYGSGVQKLEYGCKNGNTTIRFFDALSIKDGEFKYLSVSEFEEFCKNAGFTIVPNLYRGPWKERLDHELVDGNSTLASHIREGVVIRPTTERTAFKSQKRVIFKSINPKYLLKDYGDDH